MKKTKTKKKNRKTNSNQRTNIRGLGFNVKLPRGHALLVADDEVLRAVRLPALFPAFVVRPERQPDGTSRHTESHRQHQDVSQQRLQEKGKGWRTTVRVRPSVAARVRARMKATRGDEGRQVFFGGNLGRRNDLRWDAAGGARWGYPTGSETGIDKWDPSKPPRTRQRFDQLTDTTACRQRSEVQLQQLRRQQRQCLTKTSHATRAKR